MLHAVEIESDLFKDIAKGKQAYMYISNDRCIQEGDFLAINEIMGGGDTGRFILVKVTSSLEDVKSLPHGYAILSIQMCKIKKGKRKKASVYGEK